MIEVSVRGVRARLINVRGRQGFPAVTAAAAMCRVVSDLSTAKPQPGKRNSLDGGAERESRGETGSGGGDWPMTTIPVRSRVANINLVVLSHCNSLLFPRDTTSDYQRFLYQRELIVGFHSDFDPLSNLI